MPLSAGHLAILLCQPTKVKDVNDSCGRVLECVYFALSLLVAVTLFSTLFNLCTEVQYDCP